MMSSTLTAGITCPVLLKLINERDALAVASHTPYVCTHCMKKFLQDRFGGAEVLYPDGPPPWYKPPQPASQNEASTSKGEDESRKAARNPRKAKQKTRTIIPKEEIDDYLYKRSFELSDGQLLFEIKKFKKVSKDAAHQIMIHIRQRAKNEGALSPKNEKGRGNSEVINPPSNLPWCPSKRDLFPRGMLSKLRQEEQNRFLAICQNIMNVNEIRFASNLKDIPHYRKIADEERDNLENLVITTIESTLESGDFASPAHPLRFIHDMASDFVLKRCENRWNEKTFSGKFDCSAPHCSIEWSISNIRAAPEICPVLVAALLKGRVDRIQLPNLTNRCKLDVPNLFSLYPPEAVNADHIFDDMELVTSLCLENDVRVAMDATTACHLMSDPFTGHSYSYGVPIRVVEKLIQGTMTNIAVAAKPVIIGSVDPPTIQRHFIKYLLKSNFISKKADVISKPVQSQANEKKETVSSPKKKSDFRDPLDAILPSLDMPLNHAESSSSASSSMNGKTYSLFSIIGTNILLRSRPAPLCAEGRQSTKGKTLSFQPRVEYIPNAGAMRLSDAESAWNYSKGFFKQSVNHGLFRTHFRGEDVLQVQHWDVQNLTLATGSEYLWTGPTSRAEGKQIISAYTTRFAKLLQEISHLPQGDFVLVNKNDGYVKIFPISTETETSDLLDFTCAEISVADVALHMRDAFAGLEPMIPLQWQIFQHRAPGCYVANDSNLKYIAMSQPFGGGPPQQPSQVTSKSKLQKRKEKRMAKKMKSSYGDGSTEPLSEPTKPEPSGPVVDMDVQPTYCPFAASNPEAQSPTCSEPSLSPCPSPDQLMIDDSFEEENSSEI